MAEIGKILNEQLPVFSCILDPFAGTGRVHRLGELYNSVGVEIEPEWALQHRDSIIGNALALPFANEAFDALVTSPCYGNRMADHHEARDSSRRNTYTHVLGRQLHADNAGAIQWGDAYRDFHHAAWTEANRVLRSEALVIVNASNHIRRGVEQQVAEFHLLTWLELGARIVEIRRVRTQRNRQGANAHLRADSELVLVLRTAASVSRAPSGHTVVQPSCNGDRG